ncbi:dihydrofolate reductase family protein [Mycetocola zhadangensis]|uniref:Dihydrofolate reductase n=1 Tax=Mycetocola zhadangensis TaxID=1164595 RepID=A0A3L7J1C8_9MICO|nr:dihydrofolate reductase family protein [Mycetocola zhadangensis]RLQ84287.1 dihydrofolate reductase [Mycetocola zhadangensis]GGE94377.1 deaminase reductase [Mycetocola zhadangensis]
MNEIRNENGLVASAFLATSVDGFIAREDDTLDWLVGRGEALGDTGYDDFFASIDAMVMGRGTYDVVKDFEEYPYGDKRILILSTSLESTEWPNATVHRTLDDALETLEREGITRVYADGGKTVSTFLREGLLSEITISVAPVLIGSGIRLFGQLESDVELELTATRALDAGFTQSTYRVVRSAS